MEFIRNRQSAEIAFILGTKIQIQDFQKIEMSERSEQTFVSISLLK